MTTLPITPLMKLPKIACPLCGVPAEIQGVTEHGILQICCAKGCLEKLIAQSAERARAEARLKAAELMAEALEQASRIITLSVQDGHWWMDCPDKGGFDPDAINAALAAYRESAQ